VVRLLGDDKVQFLGRTDSAGGSPHTHQDVLPSGRRPHAPSHENARNQTEAIIAEEWCEVLGLQQVWVQENFFDIGGTSLKAIQLRLQLQRVMELDLPSRIFFDSPTVEAQARFVEQTRCENRAQDGVAFASPEMSLTNPTEVEDFESLRNRLEQLSDEDVDRLLNETIADGD
jgi:hypothetical protein